MSKIFRLHTGAAETIRGWTRVNSDLHDQLVGTIEDPAGADAKRQITSIPSPFARIDLVRNAFQYINNTKDLDGDTVYHKIVSDSLDVGQVFFNAEALNDKVEIISWDPGIQSTGNDVYIREESDLGKLIYSSDPSHRLYGETLKMFLMEDAKTYNFLELQRMFLVNYYGGPDKLNIVGGTSPATLFFASANEDIKDYVDLRFGNDKLFDQQYFPLYKRDKDYILYWYSLRQSINGFAQKFKTVDEYLELTYQKLSPALKSEIRALNNEHYETTYHSLNVGAHGDAVEVLRFPIRRKVSDIDSIQRESDFAIASTVPSDQNRPLVLPNEQFTEPFNYIGGVWNPQFRAPYADNRPLGERTLPGLTHVRYPYLTVSDLLESKIMRLPYPINKSKYFSGGLEDPRQSYAIPIKNEFFNYFTLDDLKRPLADGRKMFELIPFANNTIKAVLRVPIKNGTRYIEFSRIYLPNSATDRIMPPDDAGNRGIILNSQFGLTLFPFFKFTDHPAYRVMFIDKDDAPLTRHNQYDLRFYRQNGQFSEVPARARKNRSQKAQHLASTSYFVIEDNFDVIEVRNQQGRGLIIPLFEPLIQGNHKYTFAIDFGTTNTHIEFKKEGETTSRPFEITNADLQLASLHDPAPGTRDVLIAGNLALLMDLIPVEFLPERIGDTSEARFPQRTVVADNEHFNELSDATYAMADFNIPFSYLKESLPKQITVTPNLKWSNFNDNVKLRKRTEGFLEKLMLLIRNKVLLNGGKLTDTRILWFYPSSMSEYRKGLFQGVWENLYRKYIGSEVKIQKMSESVAPFYYYNRTRGVLASHRPVASVDIGGGTTDIVLYNDTKPICLTSFRFAANAVFGDAYGNSPGKNGFISKYEPKILNTLSSAPVQELQQVNHAIRSSQSNSMELTEFFFSLENNKKIRDNNISISYARDLAHDEEMKIVFIVFYGALMYHMANLMKAYGLRPPAFVTFSGTGSKILNILEPGTQLKQLKEFTKHMFQKVFSEPVEEIRLEQIDNPKEITCKGGLLCENFAELDAVEHTIKTTLLGDEQQTLISKNNEKSYAEIENSGVLDSVTDEVKKFVDVLFDIHKEFSFYTHLGINPKHFDLYKKWLTEDLKMYTIAGIKQVKDDPESGVRETLFFYPLIGALNKLAYKIHSEATPER